MLGRFIGRDGSMGLRKNEKYKIQVVRDSIYPLGIRVDSLVDQTWTVVPYATLESFLTNWELLRSEEQ